MRNDGINVATSGLHCSRSGTFASPDIVLSRSISPAIRRRFKANRVPNHNLVEGTIAREVHTHSLSFVVTNWPGSPVNPKDLTIYSNERHGLTNVKHSGSLLQVGSNGSPMRQAYEQEPCVIEINHNPGNWHICPHAIQPWTPPIV